MDYYKKYLSLLSTNNITGGKIETKGENSSYSKFYNKGKILHYPLTWNLQNNQFYRWPFILKLIKLKPETIKKIINNNLGYENFLECILIPIDEHEDKLKRYTAQYDMYLKDNYMHNYTEKLMPKSHVVYIKNLIDYFIETHKLIDQELEISDQLLEESIAKMTQEHLSLCRDLYYNWRVCVNTFYGLKKHDGLTPRVDPSTKIVIASDNNWAAEVAPAKDTGLFSILSSKDKIREIDTEYKILKENAIITYLKIRCEGELYNHRYNVYLEPVADRKTQPQSMYLTGPNPYHNIYYYKQKEKSAMIPTIAELKNEDTRKKYPNHDVNDYENLILDDKGEVESISKFDYGYLYGPFTRIFKPEIKNMQISNECIEVIEKLKNNQSVFILGYGGSGAGKTTALIYNKKATGVDKNGVLLNILNTNELKVIKKIEVSVHELFSNTEEVKQSNRSYNNIIFEKNEEGEFYISSTTPDMEGTYIENVRTQLSTTEVKRRQDAIDLEKLQDYEKAEKKKQVEDIVWTPTIYKWKIFREGDKKIFTGVDTIDDNIADITKKLEIFKEEKQQEDLKLLLAQYQEKKRAKEQIFDPRLICIADKNDPSKVDEADVELCDPTNFKNKPIKVSELGKFILTVVDRIRMINPTTNNPQSSRSHVLIYLKLPFVNGTTIDESKSKYCIVGDLAGVEDEFTCKEVDTQAAFLNLPLIDRVTGFPIDNGFVLDKDGNPLEDENGKIKKKIPHYTRNTRLEWSSLPTSGIESDILKFFTYDSVKRSVESDQKLQERKNLLGSLSGAFGWIASGSTQFVNPFNNDFVSVDADAAKYLEFEKQIKNPDIFNEIDKGRRIPGNLTRQKIIDVESFIQNKKIPVTSYTPNTAYTLYDKLEIQNFKKEYLIWKASQTSTGEMDFKKASSLIQAGMTNEDVLKNNSLRQYIKNFYIKKFEKEDKLEFIKVIENSEKNRELIFGSWKDGVRVTDGLYDILVSNLKLLEKSGVKDLCNERRYEGKFINQALIGMSKHISSLVQTLNSKGDPGLLKNIPLVKDACFKFFCNQEHETCFKQYIKEKSDTYNDAIIMDIESFKDIDMKTLGIAVFAVLNINRSANDPPKMPYIDINKLKDIRNDYITYKFYGQENEVVLKDQLIKSVEDAFIGKEGTIDAPKKNSILYIINKFSASIGKLSETPPQIYEKIKTDRPNFFKHLIDLIEAIDIINSLSYIGTMDFLNSVKNIYSTDMTCKLSGDNSVTDFDEPINSYRNAVNNKPLSEVIYSQKNPGKESSRLQMSGPRVEPAKLDKAIPASSRQLVAPPPPVPEPKAKAKAKALESIDSILGGYIDNRSSYVNQKDELKNEYKQLKKMYKRMKNNVI